MIPSDVIWSYAVAGAVLAVWLVATRLRQDWSRARGAAKLLLLGPLFFAAPLAGFGTEHFTRTESIAAIVPAWLPWHEGWTYLVGACFIAAGLSFVTRVQARLAARLLALTFLCFVVLMDAPAWAQDPGDPFALALALRQLSFSGGALALAASLTPRSRATDVLATTARLFVGIPILVFALLQLRHGDHVPGIPLNQVTPGYVPGHSFWTYLAAVIYACAGPFLLLGQRARAAATWLGVTVLLLVLVVYVPIAVTERTTIKGFNFVADTLMFCGAVLLLASALPRDASGQEASTRALPRAAPG